MRRIMLKSKIHRATVTGSDLHYAGSLTLDPGLLAQSDILQHEQVTVVDLNNGERFETYALAGDPGSGEVRVNGGAARLVHRGDIVIIFSYAHYDPEELSRYEPRIVHVDARNRVLRVDSAAAAFAPGMAGLPS